MAKIGDLIPKAGIFTNPGVVTEKKEDGTVVVDTDPMAINKYHRYSNTTGLTEKEKHKFNSLLDEIYSNDDDVKKIDLIQNKIDDLKVDPANHNVVQYLRNQQTHLIRKTQSLPTKYRADSTTLRI
jgi:SLT domain-containing protein